jgi:hypothetical protein
MVGCELDLLCDEAERMAKRLGEQEGGAVEGVTDSLKWEIGGVKWEKVLGEDHGEFLLRRNAIQKKES